MGAVEALYIFDEHNNEILEHLYAARPPSADTLLSSYLSHPSPRPSLIQLPNTTPPCLLFSLLQDRLLFLCPSALDSTNTEPLLVLEFLHRVGDAFEDFLGAPLLASKIEANYDVAAQILGEMCDAGVICNTEPNALREVVEAPNWVGSLLGGLGLPAASPGFARPSSSSALQRPGSLTGQAGGGPGSASLSSIPWRRSNVRHTSNELYVDIVESLSVVYAPSGRPVSAFANGTIAFNSKISGVPDLQLNLSAPGGIPGIQSAMELPCFHPCVRLARWKERPGELSFVPPDGRFVLAGYECNLLPDLFATEGSIPEPNLGLPASIQVNPSIGPRGDELEVRLMLSSRALSTTLTQSSSASAFSSSRTPSNTGRFGQASPAFNSNSSGTSSSPTVENIVISIPISSAVRNITDLRSNRGEAHFSPNEDKIEWRIPTKEAATIGSAGATMRCTLVGHPKDNNESEANDLLGPDLQTDTYDYDESNGGDSYQVSNGATSSKASQLKEVGEQADARSMRANAALMPRSASLSFSVRGWLVSGIRVDGLSVNTKTSKGLGAGVTPYKGVKYLTVSQDGVEVRC